MFDAEKFEEQAEDVLSRFKKLEEKRQDKWLKQRYDKYRQEYTQINLMNRDSVGENGQLTSVIKERFLKRMTEDLEKREYIKQNNEATVMSRKRKLEEDELKHCTFAPKIITEDSQVTFEAPNTQNLRVKMFDSMLPFKLGSSIELNKGLEMNKQSKKLTKAKGYKSSYSLTNLHKSNKDTVYEYPKKSSGKARESEEEVQKQKWNQKSVQKLSTQRKAVVEDVNQKTVAERELARIRQRELFQKIVNDKINVIQQRRAAQLSNATPESRRKLQQKDSPLKNSAKTPSPARVRFTSLSLKNLRTPGSLNDSPLKSRDTPNVIYKHKGGSKTPIHLMEKTPSMGRRNSIKQSRKNNEKRPFVVSKSIEKRREVSPGKERSQSRRSSRGRSELKGGKKHQKPSGTKDIQSARSRKCSKSRSISVPKTSNRKEAYKPGKVVNQQNRERSNSKAQKRIKVVRSRSKSEGRAKGERSRSGSCRKSPPKQEKLEKLAPESPSNMKLNSKECVSPNKSQKKRQEKSPRNREWRLERSPHARSKSSKGKSRSNSPRPHPLEPASPVNQTPNTRTIKKYGQTPNSNFNQTPSAILQVKTPTSNGITTGYGPSMFNNKEHQVLEAVIVEAQLKKAKKVIEYRRSEKQLKSSDNDLKQRVFMGLPLPDDLIPAKSMLKNNQQTQSTQRLSGNKWGSQTKSRPNLPPREIFEEIKERPSDDLEVRIEYSNILKELGSDSREEKGPISKPGAIQNEEKEHFQKREGNSLKEPFDRFIEILKQKRTEAKVVQKGKKIAYN